MDFIERQITRDGLRGRLIVTGQHDQLEAFLLKLAEHFCRIGFERILHGDEADDLILDRDKHHRLGIRA